MTGRLLGRAHIRSDDPYQRLGVGKAATQAEIQKAYRRLAKKLHPDINPGDSKAEEQFKEVAGAYDLLGDAANASASTMGKSMRRAPSAPGSVPIATMPTAGANQYTSGAGFSDFEGADDILSELFGRHADGQRSAFRMRSADVEYRLAVDFLDAVNGARRQITLPDGATLEVSIPPGLREGQTLRLRGKGQAGPGTGAGHPRRLGGGGGARTPATSARIRRPDHVEIRAYCLSTQFEAEAVEDWIQASWLLPREEAEGQLSDIDLARAQLIHDLTANLGINNEGVPIILDLIDQVHGLRRALRDLLERSRRTLP